MSALASSRRGVGPPSQSPSPPLSPPPAPLTSRPVPTLARNASVRAEGLGMAGARQTLLSGSFGGGYAAASDGMGGGIGGGLGLGMVMGSSLAVPSAPVAPTSVRPPVPEAPPSAAKGTPVPRASKLVKKVCAPTY